MAEVRARVLILGRVQGVFFRAFTREEAEKRSLKGWVRNLYTGQVEAVFQGKEKDVKSMIEWCHQGPSASQVTEVQISWEQTNPSEGNFRVLYT